MEGHCCSLSNRSRQVLSGASATDALQKVEGAHEDMDRYGRECCVCRSISDQIDDVIQVQALEQAYDYWEKFQFDIIAAKVRVRDFP